MALVVTTTSVAFIQPYVPEYRVPFFTKLQAELARRDMDLSIHTGPSLRQPADARNTPWTFHHSDPFAGIARDRVRWRLGTSRLTRNIDLVVIEHAVKNLESWRLLLGADHTRVAMWGHGAVYSGQTDPVVRTLRSALTRRAGWFFSYTAAGAEAVSGHGYPRSRTTVVHNATDTRQLLSDRPPDRTIQNFRTKYSLTAGHTAIYIGRLEAYKGIPYLLDAARHAGLLDPYFRLLVAGHGSLTPLVQQATAAGAPVVHIGSVSGVAKAQALFASDIAAIPYAIGLVACDALTAGLPIVSLRNQGHGPEADYVAELATWLPEDTSPVAYADALVHDLNSARLANRQENCRVLGMTLSVERTVQAFADGLDAWRSSLGAPSAQA